MNNSKKILSILLVVTLILTSIVPSFASGNNGKSKNDEVETYYYNDTKVLIKREDNKVIAESYVDGVLFSTSIVDTISGDIIEKYDGKVDYKHINDFIKIDYNSNENVVDIEDSSKIGVQPRAVIEPPGGSIIAPSGYTYLTSWAGHVKNPSLRGYLWKKDTTRTGSARTLNFSTGSKVSTVLGVVSSVIVGVSTGGFGSILIALGTSATGGVIAAYIDGKIWAVDKYRYFKTTVKNKVTFSTYRFTRYSQVINDKNGKKTLVYINKYGNWNSYNNLIYQGLSNYL